LSSVDIYAEMQVFTINIAKVVLGIEALELRHHLRTTRQM